MLNSATLGLISNSNGFDNEMEILTSHSLALQVVKDMKIYVDYYFVGKVKDEPALQTAADQRRYG